MLNIRAVRHRGAYRLWLQFNDGTEGEIDLASHLHGVMFEPLRDLALFAAVRVDPEIRTIAWPNGADFAPEYLHALLESGVPAS
jgi:hypothetical protein